MYLKTQKYKKRIFEYPTISYSPSGINEWIKCPGYIELVPAEKSEEAMKGQELHKEVHEALIKQFKSSKKLSCRSDESFLETYYEALTKYHKNKKTDILGVEEKVQSRLLHHIIEGTPDIFWFRNNTLTVIDLKTGWKPPKSFLQLKMYAFMICETFDIVPHNINLIYFSRTKEWQKKSWNFNKLMKFKSKISHFVNYQKSKLSPSVDNCSGCYNLASCVKGVNFILKEASTKEKDLRDLNTISNLKKSLSKIYDSWRKEAVNAYKNKNEDKLKQLNITVKEEKRTVLIKDTKDYRKLSKDKRNFKEITTYKVSHKYVENPHKKSFEEYMKKEE